MPYPGPTTYPSPSLYPGATAEGEPTQRVYSNLYFEMLEDLPPFLRDDPDIQASLLVQANELTRIQDRLDAIIAQFWPQSATNQMPIWEKTLGLAADDQLTIEQRQQRALAFIAQAASSSSGASWEQNVTALVGENWDYNTSFSGPTARTVIVTIPFASGSSQAAYLRKLLRIIVPANMDIEVTYSDGFVVGYSLIGEESL